MTKRSKIYIFWHGLSLSGGFAPSAVVYTVFIHTQCRIRDIYSAYCWFLKMLEQGIERNDATQYLLIYALQDVDN
jgi:pentatricopeptide repeat protein